MKVGSKKEIKHFSGYGKVTAYVAGITKYEDIFGQHCENIIISVRGNHERGLELYDNEDAYEWLLTKFSKKIKREQVIHISSNDYYVETPIKDEKNVTLTEENCDYTFIVLLK